MPGLYIFSTLLFFFQIVVIVQCMHIIYQMKENLSVCMNIFFKINIKKKDGVENYFCKVRFSISYFPVRNSWGLIDSDHSKQQWVNPTRPEALNLTVHYSWPPERNSEKT